MKKLQQLREERASKIAASTAVFEAAEKDGNRSLSDDEKQRVRTLQAEIKALNDDIELAETQEDNERSAAGRAPSVNGRGETQTQKDLRGFSLRKVALAVMEGTKLTGLEAEMSQEAVREASLSGITLERGGHHIPSFIAFQQRDNSVTMPTQPADGKAVVFDDSPQPLIGLLRPQLAIERLGASVLTGLVGDVPFPAMTQGAVASWKPEVAPLDKSNVKFRRTTMKPHRCGTYLDVSLQFLLQTSPAIETELRSELQNATDFLLDRTALYGTGLEADNQPLGLLGTPGVYVLNAGANGRVATLKDIVALEASVDIRNAATGQLGYLMNSKIKGTLKTTQIVDGQALMVLTSNGELNGHPLVVSNIVSDQTRGTATQASAIAFGDWSQLKIGQWGGLTFTIDNLTLALNGQKRLIVQSFWDIFTRRPESFAVMVGALPSAEIGALAPQA